MENQQRWFANISNNVQFRYWVIYYKSVPIGVVNLAEIDPINLKWNAGYYIGDEDYKSLGEVILPYLYNYIFKNLGFRKIYGSVVSNNDRILQIH
jgi:UDP-4-amino-4,6-dideoxy-N-acetyl-beta-L-altrosamine N-acetyltransferase